MERHDLLAFTESVKHRFDAARSILSFREYLHEAAHTPTSFCRNSTQYLHDAIHHFGTQSLDTPQGKELRYLIFDRDPQEKGLVPPKTSWVAGQEQAQQALVRMLNQFIRQGRNTRLLLLHGPNGSGKSSLVQCLIDGLERYAHTPEGAIYRFNWIFPSERKVKRSGIGFSTDEKPHIDLDSYAHLNSDQIDARLASPMKDHPLLLLPRPERQGFLLRLRDEGKLPKDFQISEYLRDGDLSPRNRMIFDTLLAHYGGDFQEVLRHIQVERYYPSQRYRRSIVTIEPQMHVDAIARQVTADHSFSALPKVLSTLSLFEPMGALVDANRGLLEYADLLKRPLEAFKYLLGTCETNRVTVDHIILFLDIVMLGSANEQNLDRFKEIAEFTSFKSRIELIRVPYLLRFSTEQALYDQFLQESNLSKHITPHLTQLAAIWAVMTRLRRPNPKRLPEAIASIVESITPLEKARLYDDGTLPRRFNSEQSKLLKQHIHAIALETRNDIHYEGRVGVSPREMRTLLLNTAQNERYASISPLALFDEMESLVQERSVYEFLQLEPKEGYYDPESFIDTLRDIHLDMIEDEFRRASGLVQPNQFQKQFERYIDHVKAYLRKEKLINPVTQKPQDPDPNVMNEVEDILIAKDETRDDFRNATISKIAAASLENPGKKIDLSQIFARSILSLEADFFARHQKRLERIARHVLILLVDPKNNLSESEAQDAAAARDSLIRDFGYSEACVKELVGLLVRERFQQPPAQNTAPTKPEGKKA